MARRKSRMRVAAASLGAALALALPQGAQAHGRGPAVPAWQQVHGRGHLHAGVPAFGHPLHGFQAAPRGFGHGHSKHFRGRHLHGGFGRHRHFDPYGHRPFAHKPYGYRPFSHLHSPHLHGGLHGPGLHLHGPGVHLGGGLLIIIR